MLPGGNFAVLKEAMIRWVRGSVFPTGVGMNRDYAADVRWNCHCLVFPTGVGMNRIGDVRASELRPVSVPHRRGDEPTVS